MFIFRQNFALVIDKIRFLSVLPLRLSTHAQRENPFKQGEMLQYLLVHLTACANSHNLSNPTGLGRWSGSLIAEKQRERSLRLIEHVQGHQTSPLGSTFLREYEFLSNKKQGCSNPQADFFRELQELIRRLQEERGPFYHSYVGCNLHYCRRYSFLEFHQILPGMTCIKETQLLLQILVQRIGELISFSDVVLSLIRQQEQVRFPIVKVHNLITEVYSWIFLSMICL